MEKEKLNPDSLCICGHKKSLHQLDYMIGDQECGKCMSTDSWCGCYNFRLSVCPEE